MEKKRGRKHKPPNAVELPEDRKVNLTDPESEILKTCKSWVQGYNEQAMVDCKSQVIVAQEVIAEANDVGHVRLPVRFSSNVGRGSESAKQNGVCPAEAPRLGAQIARETYSS